MDRDTKKIDIISVLAIVIVSGVFYSIFLKDDFSACKTLRDKRASLNEAITRDRNTIDAHKNKAADILRLEKEISENKLFFIKEEKVPYFINYASSLARQYRIGILSIEPGETLINDSVSKATFMAELRGRFPNMYNFLYHLEDDWKGVKVETITMDKNPEDRSVSVRLTLAVLSVDGYQEKI